MAVDALRRASWLERTVSRVVERPAAAIAAGLVLGVVGLHVWIDPANPPGFHRDEASLAYNAHTVSQTLRDERGGLLPLYIPSFGDYKSALFIYPVSAVFRVTGPSESAARAVAAVAVLTAVLLLGLLALRRTGDPRAAVATVVLAGATPWLFELGRVAVEVTLLPLIFVVFLLVIETASRTGGWRARNAVAAGALLALSAYAYAGARLLAPLFAAALAVFLGRAPLRWLLTAWATFAAGLVPLAVYALRHPGALTARYDATTFVRDDMSRSEVVMKFLGNLATDLSLWRYATGGDPKPHIHVAGTGMLLAAGLVLAVAGAVIGARRGARDRWPWFVLALGVFVAVPAALTQDRLNGYRLALLPVVLAVLAIPALAALAHGVARSRLAIAAAAVLAVVGGAQFAHFLAVRTEKGGPSRAILYEAAVPGLLERALSDGRAVYMDADEPRAHAHARWYAVSRGLPLERVVVLPDGWAPPDGSIVFGRSQPCDFACVEIARRDGYWIARAETG